jgi:hypothetical protein
MLSGRLLGDTVRFLNLVITRKGGVFGWKRRTLRKEQIAFALRQAESSAFSELATTNSQLLFLDPANRRVSPSPPHSRPTPNRLRMVRAIRPTTSDSANVSTANTKILSGNRIDVNQLIPRRQL